MATTEQELSARHHNAAAKGQQHAEEEGQSSPSMQSACIVRYMPFMRKIRLSLLHALCTLLLIASMAASVNYLQYKFRLYVVEIRQVARAPWLLLILACECLYLISNFIAAVDYLVPPNVQRPKLLLPPHDKNGHDDVDGGSPAPQTYPRVDIFLPCCKEPTEVPQESLMAALAMDYPPDRFRVVVLDDGGDDELKAFCDSHGAALAESGLRPQLVYLRRTKTPGVPHHFKCGNLNYGLQHSDAEYVVMMDADMILHPSLFRSLLPHIMYSPNVSFVQVPQSFYNLPIGDPLNDACGFGYDRVMVHRDTLGCANCVGTGAIFRRAHLDEIGGFQPASITEDTMTAFILFNHGYKSVYLNEKLQIGLTPWTFEGYVKQRQRWGQGAIQQFSATWKSMLGRGSKLNLPLKFNYFWHTGYYYMSGVNIVLALTLLACLAFNLRLVVGSDAQNHTLVSDLALFLVVWRVLWFALWCEVPQAIQSRNRDESQFWWMTPFFFEMVMKAAWDMKSTFKFVPTSNIDRRVKTKGTNSSSTEAEGASCASFLGLKGNLRELKHVRVHLIFVAVALAVVAARAYIAFGRHGSRECKETFVFIGLSFFVVPVCAHMMVPVFHIMWSTGFKPEQRKSLLQYNAAGVPHFKPEVDCYPKWHWSLIIYELISYASLAFWVLVFWAVRSGSYEKWCYDRRS